MRKLLAASLGFGLSLTAPAFAQGNHVVGLVQGYTCMMADIPDSDRMNFTNPMSFKAAPDASAPDALVVTPQVAVKTGAQPVNGFLPVLQANGKEAWIEASKVAPYSLPGMPRTKCYVAKMSNGAIGFSHPTE
ncbi:hypothetical protein [Acetobacter sp.]|uniref:hypothetical protein n=1 Tax=Acetobacter sp. TaxID=440 RepID=UPI0039EA5B95